MIKLLMTLGLLFSCKHMSAGEILIVDNKRLVTISDFIGQQMFVKSSQLEKLARTIKPIYVKINSQGGSVNHGEIFISAIKIAQQRGVRVICFSTTLSASVAFSIMLSCSRNYVLSATKILFHKVQFPPTASSFQKDRAKNTDNDLIKLLKIKLNLDEKDIIKARDQERMWYASEIVPLFRDNSFKIVTDIRNVDNLFQ